MKKKQPCISKIYCLIQPGMLLFKKETILSFGFHKHIYTVFVV